MVYVYQSNKFPLKKVVVVFTVVFVVVIVVVVDVRAVKSSDNSRCQWK
jgi:hypothetical protein